MKFLFNKLLSPRRLEDKKLRNTIYAITMIRPGNLALYDLALQHSSVKDTVNSNERLEFLGDAVLSLIIAEFLFKKYPLEEEGFLTEIRSRIVNRASLSCLAKKLGIDVLLQHDKSTIHRGNFKFIYGNALEALIGAVYLDKGYKNCRKFVLNQLLHLHIDLEALIQNDTNYKSQLIEWAGKNRKKVQFEIIGEEYVQGIKEFTARVCIEKQVAGQGKGSNKKQAEQQAAQVALGVLSSMGSSA